MEIEVLLSDKFISFSKQIAEIAAAKKQCKADFKVVYDKFQEDTRNLDQQALGIQADFEQWKKERESSVGDG